jgi:tight adherence protein B
MKRAALSAAVTFAFALAALASSAGATSTGGLRVVEAKGPGFPVRSFVISLPTNRRLNLAGVQVTENGAPVVEPTLVPAVRASKKSFGVVLVLDESYSMHGHAIDAAIGAANAFVAHRNPNEQLGIVTFNRKTKMLLPLTTSPVKINAALAEQPKLFLGTHIFDAVAQAEAMLTRAHITSGSILVLSDGHDTGSTHTLPNVTTAAVDNSIRIYAIGLADHGYKPATLKALAQQGGGEYSQAQAQALAPLFDQIGRLLSKEYLLQYKSLVGPGKSVRVAVQVQGIGTSTSSYQTPALPVKRVVAASYHPSLTSRILGSWVTMILVALLGAAVIAFLAIVLLQPRRSGLPARMAEFVSIRDLQRDKGHGPAAAAVAGEDGSTLRKPLWERFEETLEIADIKVEPEWIVAGTIAATGLVFLLIWAAAGSPWWGLFALAVPYIAREWVIRTLAHRRNRFAEQLPDALQVVASALRSGNSLAGSLAVVVEGASEPMKTEMQRVVADEQLGIPIETSMNVVAERMASRDVEQLALVAELQREAGGNAAEVVDRVAETVRERFDLKRLIQTLTTQGRLSRWIVSALPVGIILFLQIENPHYLHPLVQSTGGKIVFGLAAAWAALGSYVIKKIVEIEV